MGDGLAAKRVRVLVFLPVRQEIICVELTGSQSLSCSYSLVFGYEDVESRIIHLSVCNSWFQVFECHVL